MSGIYIHFPYCTQKCHFCDFATVTQKTPDYKTYLDCLILEIQKRSSFVPFKKITSIYFGGGTPSLMSHQHISAILNELKKQGFIFDSEIEITLESNPGQLTEDKIDCFSDLGINRFSVGVQSFNNSLIQKTNRKHTAKDSIQLIDLLNKKNLTYCLDLLFGLPHQSLKHVMEDLKQLKSWSLFHVSAYLLTLPKNHFFNQNRALDKDQIKMFEVIKNELESRGLIHYEISNFGKKKFFSKHNQLYWNLKNYWGLGMSAHSFFTKSNLRFWNPYSLKSYLKQISELNTKDEFYIQLPNKQKEFLKKHELLTDFCYTSLRQCQSGLKERDLKNLFPECINKVKKKLNLLEQKKWLYFDKKQWKLTWEGLCLSDTVFSEIAFLEEDLKEC